jgi:hypothetical protein
VCTSTTTSRTFFLVGLLKVKLTTRMGSCLRGQSSRPPLAAEGLPHVWFQAESSALA